MDSTDSDSGNEPKRRRSWRAISITALVFGLIHLAFCVSIERASIEDPDSYVGYFLIDAPLAILAVVLWLKPLCEAMNAPFLGLHCQWFFIVFGTLMYAAVGAGVCRLYLRIRRRRQRKASEFPRCEECGYNLTGNVSGLCPECGTPVLPPEPESESD